MLTESQARGEMDEKGEANLKRGIQGNQQVNQNGNRSSSGSPESSISTSRGSTPNQSSTVSAQ